MSKEDYGMAGLAALAEAGLRAITVLSLAAVILIPAGLIALAWWAWHHVSIQ